MQIVIPIFAITMLVMAIYGIIKIPQRKIIEPSGSISTSVYKYNIVGAGVTEPKSETIEIGADIGGIVDKIYVTPGQNVKKNVKLFSIDSKQAKANYDLANSQYKIAKIQARDVKQQFLMFKKIKDKRAISKDEFERKKYAYELSKEKVKESEAQMEISKIALKKLTIKAPIEGQILKINIRPGQFASSGNPSKPLMTIGDLSKMYVRVEIDETEAHKVMQDSLATASLRGRPEIKIPLEFIRFEPYIVPKTTITGANTEKIDTRVLEVLYGFDNNENILVGQQMDVYIETHQ